MAKQVASIRFLVMDMDGTLTDGRIYFGPEGEALKAFDVKDGYAIKCMLPEMGVVPVVITARESKMVELRCEELGVKELHQGAFDKLSTLIAILESYSERDSCGYTLGNVAYIGDDILDLQCMRPVKDADGIVGCPSNAVREVSEIADFQCLAEGGRGAVREFIDYLEKAQRLKPSGQGAD